MPFQINAEKGIFKTIAFLSWLAYDSVEMVLFGRRDRVCTGGGGGGGRVNGDYVNIALDQSILGGKLFRFPTQTAG